MIYEGYSLLKGYKIKKYIWQNFDLDFEKHAIKNTFWFKNHYRLLILYQMHYTIRFGQHIGVKILSNCLLIKFVVSIK